MRLFPPSFVSQRQLIQFDASLTPARIFLFKDRDKSIAVGWLNEMNHFVDYNILKQVFRLLDQLSIESDVSGLWIAASPFCFHALKEIAGHFDVEAFLLLITTQS